MKDQMYDYFNSLEEHHWWFRARRAIILELIQRFSQKRQNVRILDIGCGTGATLKALSGYGELWGLDPSEKAIAYANKKVPSAHLLQGSFPETIPSGQFDLICALDVLEHIQADTEALETIHSLVAPGGIAILTVPAYQWLWTSHDNWNEHKRRYYASELRAKAEQAGLTLKKLSYYNTFLFPPIASVKIATRFFLKTGRSHFQPIPPPRIVNTILYALFASEKHLLPHFNLPFGISLVAVAS